MQALAAPPGQLDHGAAHQPAQLGECGPVDIGDLGAPSMDAAGLVRPGWPAGRDQRAIEGGLDARAVATFGQVEEILLGLALRGAHVIAEHAKIHVSRVAIGLAEPGSDGV